MAILLNLVKQDANPSPKIIKRKMALFGHACRDNRCNLVKKCILVMMPGKKKGCPRMQYIDY